MAFTELYCKTTGSNLNGGGLATGAEPTDAAAYTSTNGGWNSGTGVFTPTSGNPSLTVSVGDFASIFLDAATVGVFVGRVTAVSSTTVTVSTSAKSGTAPTTAGSGITCKVGGAWKGPNGAEGFPFGFVTGALTNSSANIPRVNLKAGTNYAVTANITHNAAGPVVFQGYTASAGDLGRAIIDGGAGASYVLFTASSAASSYVDLIFQNNGASGANSCINGSTSDQTFLRCVVNNSGASGFGLTARCAYVECEAYACNTSNTASVGGFSVGGSGTILLRCVAHDNSGSNSVGFRFTNTAICVNCIADTNGSHGFFASGSTLHLVGCVGYSNSGSGAAASGSLLFAENNIFNSNLAYGVDNQGSSNAVYVSNCAFLSNTSGQTNGTVLVTASITLSGDPFITAATGNFTLNNTAGAACRAAGRGAFTQTQVSYTGTVSFPDVGAAQVTDVGGGGSAGPIKFAGNGGGFAG